MGDRHLLESFVVGEVRKQVSWMDAPIAMGHWRTDAGEEVDLVLEDDAGRVIAIEVKADQRVEAAGLKGMRTLRDSLGDRFVGGVAMTTGSRSYTYEERIHVCPIDRLWTVVLRRRCVGLNANGARRRWRRRWCGAVCSRRWDQAWSRSHQRALRLMRRRLL